MMSGRLLERVDRKAVWRGPHMREGPHIDSFSAICTQTYTFLHRDKLARLKEDGIHHPNLNLFLINGYSACSAL